LILDSLPLNLEVIDPGAFNLCYNLMISEFGTESSAPKLNAIKGSAFYGAGNNVMGPIYFGRNNLEVGAPTLNIGSMAFQNYGTANMTINVAQSVSLGVVIDDLGFEGNITVND